MEVTGGSARRRSALAHRSLLQKRGRRERPRSARRGRLKTARLWAVETVVAFGAGDVPLRVVLSSVSVSLALQAYLCVSVVSPSMYIHYLQQHRKKIYTTFGYMFAVFTHAHTSFVGQELA